MLSDLWVHKLIERALGRKGNTPYLCPNVMCRAYVSTSTAYVAMFRVLGNCVDMTRCIKGTVSKLTLPKAICSNLSDILQIKLANDPFNHSAVETKL